MHERMTIQDEGEKGEAIPQADAAIQSFIWISRAIPSARWGLFIVDSIEQRADFVYDSGCANDSRHRTLQDGSCHEP